MKFEKRAAYRVGPPASQARKHEPRVSAGREQSPDAADGVQQSPFGQKQIANSTGLEPHGQKNDNMPGALLDIEQEHECHEHGSRNDDE